MTDHTFEVRAGRVYIDGKEVGRIVKTMGGEKAYVTYRNRMGRKPEGKGHILEILKSYGICEELFQYLKSIGVTQIQIRRGESEMLISSIKTWEAYGIVKKFPPYETQRFLKIDYMTRRLLPSSMLSK